MLYSYTLCTIFTLFLPFSVQHDPTTSECTPLLGGNFLMFSSASTGQDPNNNKFSPCSIRLMNTIISGTAQAGDDKCFIGLLLVAVVLLCMCVCVCVCVH